MAQVIAGSVAGVAEALAEVASAETELAALAGTETALEAEMAIESAGGPIGWIAVAITAGILLTVVLAVIAANDRLQTARFNLTEAQTAISQPKPPPPTQTNPNKTPLAPEVTKILNSIPIGPVVMFSEFYDCDDDSDVRSRCDRKLFSHY